MFLEFSFDAVIFFGKLFDALFECVNLFCHFLRFIPQFCVIFRTILDLCDNFLDDFVQLMRRKVSKQFGIVSVLDIEGAPMFFQDWMIFHGIFNMSAVFDTKGVGKTELFKGAFMGIDAGGQIIGVSKLDERFMVGIGIVDESIVDTLGVSRELFQERLFADKFFVFDCIDFVMFQL